MKRLRIMVVCGFGLGSSMVLRLTLDSVLKESGIDADTFCSDEASSRGEKFDIVFTSQPLAHIFDGISKPLVIINNFLSKEEVKQKGMPIIQKLAAE